MALTNSMSHMGHPTGHRASRQPRPRVDGRGV